MNNGKPEPLRDAVLAWLVVAVASAIAIAWGLQ